MKEHKDLENQQEYAARQEDSPEEGDAARQEDSPEEEYSFLQETIKDEAGGAPGKVRRDIFRTACLGLVLGIVACFSFYAVKPLMEEWFEDSPREVKIPEEEEEEEPVASENVEEQTAHPLDEEDYRQMQQSMTATALEASRCVAEIVGVTGDEDWMTDAYDSRNSVSGLIIADNGRELLVFAKTSVTEEAREIRAAFYDGSSYTATLKKRDANLGYGIYAVNRSEIQQGTWAQIRTATLGSSGSMTKGSPVIAVGKQFGYSGGIGFGTAASTRNSLEKADGSYRLIGTDIAAAQEGTGVLFNLEGEAVAMIDQTISEESSMNLVTGYGMTDMKDIIENLSNAEAVPYLGIHGIDVTEEIRNQGIPEGVYVKEVDAGAPAMTAGIQAGDIITSIDGVEIRTLSAYHTALMEKDSGSELRVKGQRRGSGGYVDITFTVTVGSKE